MSVMNSMKHIFPEVRHLGWFFHFSQFHYRKLKKLRLKKNYDTNIEFSFSLKLLPSIAFVQLNLVAKSFDVILEQNLLPPSLQPVVDYFEDTWVGRFERRQTKEPMFPYGMWNFYDNVMTENTITNNKIEG